MIDWDELIRKNENSTTISDISDGYHTFNELYEQRRVLFAALVKAYKDKAWKSFRHEDGEYCFGGGWFIVGIDTPKGSYTYHYENNYWNMFDCVALPCAKHWDGHTEKDVTRLFSLPSAQPERERGEWILVKGSNGKDYHKCSECLHTQDITGVKNYCAVCGAEMRGEQDG